ncbi:cytochrome P450 [Streptomyces sp. ME19-01-6]|uniref:cytochrome P450 n=1 Tax=Streptomyces sp. ME19-01-6 TaxID=3028686 RepID=UPI0029BBBC8E|nr:cytochrome P450 [Streptomyces sp. ME19-01-6]MDX3233832.1 cytochrome P450 [Streptomyces sp. ME19-01-6]
MITRFNDARAVLGDERFSSDITNPGYPIFAEALEPMRRTPTLVTMDAPDHTRLRRLVIGEFTMRRMNTLRPQIQEVADRLVDRMLELEKPVNLAEAYSFPLAGCVIGSLLGLSLDTIEGFMSDARKATVVRDLQELVRIQRGLREFILAGIEEKERTPVDDVLSHIVAKYKETGPESYDELVTLILVIMGAGYGPTASMISNGVLALLEHPDQLEILRADPALFPDAVEETLRFVSVSDLSSMRVAAEDVEIGGQLIRAGDGVVVPNGGANHDPSVFREPTVLDVRREEAGQHLAFGHGLHQCLGGNLTRVELEIAYRTLFTRIPTLRLGVPASEIDSPEKAQLPEIHYLPVAW